MHIGRLAGLAAFLTFVSFPALAQQETLEVTFDLAQYSHPGSWSFSKGCTHTPPTGRTNYVQQTVVWLETMNGGYVTTLHRWGRSYLYNLKAWAVQAGSAVDGVTSATPTGPPDGGTMGVFAPFTTGVQNINLPDGTYRVRLESTQCELADGFRMPPNPNPFAGGTPFGPTATFVFTKGRTSQTGAMLASMGPAGPFNNVRVNYAVPASNAPPGVYAGPDQWKRPSVTPADAMARLTGVVSDPAGPPTVRWSLISTNPAGLMPTILSPTSAITDVTFTSAGVYTFRLEATDNGGLKASDDVTVFVNAQLVNSAGDADVNSNTPNTPGGTIETAGPWSWSNGPDTGNRTRAYLRYDLTTITAPVTFAQLQLRVAEQTWLTTVFHDFFILTDAQDDWNGAANSSTDYEATVTWNNQPVLTGLTSNLMPNQLAGTATHQACVHRHAYINPAVNPGERATVCPGRLDVNLNVSNIQMHDANRVWSFFMAPRPVLNNGMGLGSDENAVHSQLLVVTSWQAGTNMAPDAGMRPLPSVVVDTTPPLGAEAVMLDATPSSDDAAIVTYEWRDNGALLPTNNMPTYLANLSLGRHSIELKVIDGAGLFDTDTTTITVEDRFEPNHTRQTAATVTGSGTGLQYPSLFSGAADTMGDWYKVNLVSGSMLTVNVMMSAGNLDLRLYDSSGTLVQSATTTNLRETASLTASANGTYFIQVSSASGAATASTYTMTVTATGGLTVLLNPSSALESAGTLMMAGTVQLDAPAAAAVAVTLSASPAGQLVFMPNPVTIAMNQRSAPFAIMVVDNPPNVPNGSRFVDVTATATGLNAGSAQFEILDDDVSVFVGWDKAAETVMEGASPSVLLRAKLTAPATMDVVVPFTLGGTATPGTDFSTPTMATQLTIPAGSTESNPYLIRVTNDTEVDPNETVVATMGTPTGASASGITVYTLTIADDDTGSGTGGSGGSPDGGAGGGTGGGGPPAGCGCTHFNAALAGLALLLALRRRRR